MRLGEAVFEKPLIIYPQLVQTTCMALPEIALSTRRRGARRQRAQTLSL